MGLLCLGNKSFTDWWSHSAKGEQLIIQPKIYGCAVRLRYKYGCLTGASTPSINDCIEAIRIIPNIPIVVDNSRKVEVELIGVLFAPQLEALDSQCLAKEHLSEKVMAYEDLDFVAYEIVGSTHDELQDLTQLVNWGFDVPVTLRTDDPQQVTRWHRQWINHQLFSNYPTDGIVAKFNSIHTKNKLGSCSSYTNWALALKKPISAQICLKAEITSLK